MRKNRLTLDPDADGTQWLYRGYIISGQTHPSLKKYAIYNPDEKFVDVTQTIRECRKIIDLEERKKNN